MSAISARHLDRLRSSVAERIGHSRFRTWFSDHAEFMIEDTKLTIRVANEFIGNWIANNYLDDVAAAASAVLGDEQIRDIRVMQYPAMPKNKPTRPESPASPADSAPGHPVPPPAAPNRSRAKLRGRLDTFVVGPSNQLAYNATCQIARGARDSFNLLVVYGGCGLGKTHLLHGLCNAAPENDPTLEHRFVSGEEFTNEFITAVKAGHVDRFRARYRSVDLLIIDDIHFLVGKQATQKEFLHTFNAIDTCGKSIVLSSDRHPRALTSLSEPLRNRLIAGMVVQIEAPDLTTRREIVRRKAATMRRTIPDIVLDYVAENITRNVRELEGAIHKLAAIASLTRAPLTVELAQRVLAEQIAAGRSAPTVAQTVKAVGERFGVSPAQIMGASRSRPIPTARSIAMYLVRKFCGMSFPEMGRAMGNKNHSTVLMATQRVEKQLRDGALLQWKDERGSHEVALQELLEELEAQLSPGCD